VQNRTANDTQWIDGYCPHAATYLNGARWEDDITPVTAKAPTLPKDNDDLEAWAVANGHRTAYVGETYPTYRNYLQGLLRSES